MSFKRKRQAWLEEVHRGVMQYRDRVKFFSHQLELPLKRALTEEERRFVEIASEALGERLQRPPFRPNATERAFLNVVGR